MKNGDAVRKKLESKAKANEKQAQSKESAPGGGAAAAAASAEMVTKASEFMAFWQVVKKSSVGVRNLNFYRSTS
jgi:hypothetical protein